VSATGAASAATGALHAPWFLPGLGDGLGVVVRVVFDDRHVLTKEVLNAHKVPRFGLVTEGVRHAGSTRACRAPDAVHVDLRLVREFVVEHVRDAFNVNAAAGDVGRDEDGHVTIAEALEGPDASGLALVAVDGFGHDAVA